MQPADGILDAHGERADAAEHAGHDRIRVGFGCEPISERDDQKQHDRFRREQGGELKGFGSILEMLIAQAGGDDPEEKGGQREDFRDDPGRASCDRRTDQNEIPGHVRDEQAVEQDEARAVRHARHSRKCGRHPERRNLQSSHQRHGLIDARWSMMGLVRSARPRIRSTFPLGVNVTRGRRQTCLHHAQEVTDLIRRVSTQQSRAANACKPCANCPSCQSAAPNVF